MYIASMVSLARRFVQGGSFLRESKYDGTLENFSVLVSKNCEHLIAEDEATSLSMPNQYVYWCHKNKLVNVLDGRNNNAVDLSHMLRNKVVTRRNQFFSSEFPLFFAR